MMLTLDHREQEQQLSHNLTLIKYTITESRRTDLQ